VTDSWCAPAHFSGWPSVASSGPFWSPPCWCPPAQRWRMGAAALVPPVLLAGGALALDFEDAWAELQAPTVFIAHSHLPHGIGARFGRRGSRLIRAPELLAAVAVSLYARRRGLLALAWAGAGLLLLRPLLEPIVYPYYLVPYMTIVIFLAMAGTRQFRVHYALPSVLLTVWTLQSNLTTRQWWVGTIVLLACATGVALRPPIQRWRHEGATDGTERDGQLTVQHEPDRTARSGEQRPVAWTDPRGRVREMSARHRDGL
jgi:hypothetical protein